MSDKTDIFDEVEIVPQKITKGTGGKNNFPNSKVGLIQTSDDRRFVAELLTEVFIEYKQEKVKSDEELKQRLDDYFARCARTGQVPTVEEMSMSTGYSQSTVWDWEKGRNKGFSPETSEIIRKAKDFIKTFDAKLVVSGKLNFLAYCFRAKNYYGMSDKSELQIVSEQQEDYNTDQILEKYASHNDYIVEED